MQCLGLAQEWEGLAFLRQRVRNTGKILEYPEGAKVCLANRHNCKTNAVVLKPILRRLKNSTTWRLPHLEPLQEELKKLQGVFGGKLHEHGVYAPSVEIKKLVGFVKRRVQRKEVTKELHSHFTCISCNLAACKVGRSPSGM